MKLGRPERIVHCSYHKCLTAFYGKILSTLYNRILPFTRGYRHFNSFIDEFYEESSHYRVASINNHAIDLNKVGTYRISRFMRDPRDLVVSGYFYHKRGAERWCHVKPPTPDDWRAVNGCVPDGLKADQSLYTYLNSVDQEAGLIAEIQFRKPHFNSMLEWPTDDPRIRVLRYEEIVGNEPQAIADLLSFYGFSALEERLAGRLAARFSAGKRTGADKHIRNPEPEQWRRYFTPRVTEYFMSRHSTVLEAYGYDWS
jgi:hypothetical protein